MGGGEKGVGLLKKSSFHMIHLPSSSNHSKRHSSGGVGGSGSFNKSSIPKGYLAIKVGGEGEEQQRFIIPVLYFSHPLFLRLLKEAEEEYGFDQKGTITIPCHVEEFRYVQGMIDKERFHHQHHHNNHHHSHGSHHGHNPLVGCFRA